jgi:hypothetical protein
MATKKEKQFEGSETWPEYRNTAHVKALHDPEAGVVHVQGQRGDQWEVPEQEFFENFKPVTPNKA